MAHMSHEDDQPLRQRSVEEDHRPLATHEELINKDTGARSDVVERYHKPGQPLPEQAAQDPVPQPTETPGARAGNPQVEHWTDQYETRDNIVDPGLH